MYLVVNKCAKPGVLIQNLSKESSNITEEKLNKFKQLFLKVFSEGKVDFEGLKLILKRNASISNESYALNLVDKSEVFPATQTHTIKTLYSIPKKFVKFNSTENIFNDNFIYPDKFSETKENR
jgi:hypothetical protein